MDSLLVRKKLETPEEVALEASKEMANEAAKELGYHNLERHAHRSERDRDLRNTLKKLGIEPFETGGVHTYMDRERKKALGVTPMQAAIYTLLVVSALLWLLLLLCGSSAWGVLGIAVVPALIAGGTRADSFYGRNISWQPMLIQHYKEPIPEFALATALKIRRADPDILIEVVGLTITKDPFLAVSKEGTERYYLEVWQEPKFSAKREV
jgi:hypothetical protein